VFSSPAPCEHGIDVKIVEGRFRREAAFGRLFAGGWIAVPDACDGTPDTCVDSNGVLFQTNGCM
jgi:hypothetical protein